MTCLALFEGEIAEAEIALNDNITDFQLRWVQNVSTEGSAAWLIDEIFVICPLFSATVTFEETDRLESLLSMSSYYVHYIEHFITFGSALLVM